MPTRYEEKKAAGYLNDEINTEEADVALLILAETKDQCEKRRGAHRTIETKSASVVGFAAVVLGFAATFNSHRLLEIKFGAVPVIVPTLILESLAIIIGLMALASQDQPLPDALRFNTRIIVEDKKNVARVASSLARVWGYCERTLQAGNMTRALRFSLALWAFGFGLFYTIGVASWTVTTQGVQPVVITVTKPKVTRQAPRSVPQRPHNKAKGHSDERQPKRPG